MTMREKMARALFEKDRKEAVAHYNRLAMMSHGTTFARAAQQALINTFEDAPDEQILAYYGGIDTILDELLDPTEAMLDEGWGYNAADDKDCARKTFVDMIRAAMRGK